MVNLTENSTAAISSPDVNGDGTYVTDLDCEWTIITADNNNMLSLTFNSFNLDRQSSCPDYVEVSDSQSLLLCAAVLMEEKYLFLYSYIYLRQGGNVFAGFCLFVCLSVCLCVSKITQKVMDGSF